MVDTLKQAASKAKGPAVAVGATAVGVAGGVLLRGRMRRKTFPRSACAAFAL